MPTIEESRFTDSLWEDQGYFDKVQQEAVRAFVKHGFEQTPANPDMYWLESFVILSEEVGEVARALTYDEGKDRQALAEELIQVATMAIMMAYGVEHGS